MDDIVVCFSPFTVITPPEPSNKENYSFEINGKNVVGIDDLEWAALPDILIKKETREFLGLSFIVEKKYFNYFSELVEKNEDPRIKLFSSCKEVENRYYGFDDAPRFEVYFKYPSGEVECEVASLFEGCWLRNDSDNEIFGYWLSMVNDIRDEYGLV